jgi:hypothetical protein
MGESFDDLYNEFFKRKRSLGPDDIFKHIENEAKRMFENLPDFLKPEEAMDSMFDFTKMDEEIKSRNPDSVESSYKDGFFIEKQTWRTPNGNIERLLVSKEPFSKTNVASLQSQLDEAVANEVGRILADDHALTQHSCTKVHHKIYQFGIRTSVRDDLQQMQVARGIEEVRAQEATGEAGLGNRDVHASEARR